MKTNRSKATVMMLSFLALCLGLVSCYDDSGLIEKIKEIENRVSKLEEECKAMNTNISSLQTIVTALQQNDYVTSVAPITKDGIEIGYTISFDKSDPITIYHGKEGNTPVIGIKEHTDNIYYWTIDGEWLLDAEGNMVAVSGRDGATPKLKIEDDYWYISYDNGTTWSLLDKAVGKDGDSFFESVTQDDKCVYLTLSDGTVITLPKNSSIIQFEDINVKAICLNWDTDFDGELSYEEAAQVDTLEDKFNNTTIGIFKELKYFTKLTSLDGAFTECTQLVYIDIPSNVTSLGSNTFKGCQSLRRITLPEGVTSIGSSAFEDCSSLTAINIPEGVTSIGSSAFASCSSLTAITIPENSKLTSIGDYAFEDCSSLTAINIPENSKLTSIGGSAFSGCTSLTAINIPEGVTSIGSSAFRGCSSLTAINIPEGETSIGYATFYGCSSLTAITIPEGVTSIGDYAFYECSSLTAINIPENSQLTSIGDAAFRYCSSLTAITIPESVTSIGWYAFSECYSLKSIKVLATTPPTAYDDSFSFTSDTLYVPEEAVDIYKSTAPWSYFYTIIGF